MDTRIPITSLLHLAFQPHSNMQKLAAAAFPMLAHTLINLYASYIKQHILALSLFVIR